MSPISTRRYISRTLIPMRIAASSGGISLVSCPHCSHHAVIAFCGPRILRNSCVIVTDSVFRRLINIPIQPGHPSVGDLKLHQCSISFAPKLAVIESCRQSVPSPSAVIERPIRRTSGRHVLRKIFTFSDLIPRRRR